MTSLHAAAKVPMFALHGIGRGIVGGPLLAMDELSRTTAQVALRVLAGESPGSIKTPTQLTGQPTYDARELRRWKSTRAGSRRGASCCSASRRFGSAIGVRSLSVRCLVGSRSSRSSCS